MKKKRGVEFSVSELTNDQMKLLYLISRFSKIGKALKDPDVWLKELALRTYVFQSIILGVFKEFDYSPLSVDTVTGRMFLNISQEAEDDIVDLRMLGLVESIKLTSQSSKMITAYRVTKEGLKVMVPQSFKEVDDNVIVCKDCGDLLGVRYERNEKDNIFLICTSCGSRTDSNITEIEDISYCSVPYFPKIPYYISYAKADKKYGFLQIKGDKTLDINLCEDTTKKPDDSIKKWRVDK